MDLKQIKELIAAMEASGITKITLKEKTGFELELERQNIAPLTDVSSVVHHHHPSMHHHSPYAIPKHHDFPHIQQIPHAAVSEEKKNEEQKVEGKFITSPMVGTFYSAASPDKPPFLKVGDTVNENTVVCIIEAMKVMNEVKAGVSGVVAEIYVESGHPVEFGTKLFRVV